MKALAVRLFKAAGVHDRLQTAYRRLVFNRRRNALRRAYARHRGEGLTCNLCGASYARFAPSVPLAADADAVSRHRIIAGYHEQALCPHCMSNSRERLVVAMLAKMPLEGKRVLQLAPEENVFRFLRGRARVETADLMAYLYARIDPNVRTEDITRLSFPDATFDVVIANHILEHIPDDARAMRELYRVLVPGGTAILQVPFSRTIAQTIEEPHIADPARQSELFGQCDHVRLYAFDDYVARLRAAGFDVNYVPYEELRDLHRHAIQPDEGFFAITKRGRQAILPVPKIDRQDCLSSTTKITVITPSYNQAQFIEETIRSVLDQRYPSLEFIVMDGGSTDGTIEILKKYDDQLAYWASERDRGQAHAINKAFERATGDLVVWINSDDLLLPGSLAAYAAAYERDPSRVIVGDVVYFDKDGPLRVVKQTNVSFNGLVVPWLEHSRWIQPGTAVPRAVWAKAGPLDETYRYVFDREWGIRLCRVAGVTYLPRETAMFRLHDQSKTVGEARDWFPEEWRVTEQYVGETPYAGRRDVRAMLELLQANRMLSASTHDRARAFGYARTALRTAPSIAWSRTFALFVMRALVPRAVLSAAVVARRRFHARRRRD